MRVGWLREKEGHVCMVMEGGFSGEVWVRWVNGGGFEGVGDVG